MGASCYGHVQVVDQLLASGALISIRDRYANTAFDDAARHSHVAVMQLLSAAAQQGVGLSPQERAAQLRLLALQQQQFQQQQQQQAAAAGDGQYQVPPQGAHQQIPQNPAVAAAQQKARTDSIPEQVAAQTLAAAQSGLEAGAADNEEYEYEEEEIYEEEEEEEAED